MLNALIAAKRQGKVYTFVAVGPFESPALRAHVEEIVRREGLADQTHFIGEIPIEDLKPYYQRSKIAFCLFPPNRTNRKILPIKLFEYAAFGLPIVGSDFGHIREIIETNGIGLAIDPLSPIAAATALSNLLSDNAYLQFSPRCTRCVETRYHWGTQEGELGRVMGEVGADAASLDDAYAE
jgi:glycosyltransferase involved in cell wall biosynthesis